MTREIPVEEFIVGHYQTSLEPDELITEVVIPGGVSPSRVPEVSLPIT